MWGQVILAVVASLGELDFGLALQYQAKNLWFSTLCKPLHF